MASFNYKTYKNHFSTTSSESNERKYHFMSEFLKQPGSSIIVRFPYKSEEEFNIETCHLVNIAGYQYSQKVECKRTSSNEPIDDCPLCAEKAPLSTRFIVKLVAYVHNENGCVMSLPTVWDRPLSFAGTLADYLTAYGDLSQYLFKVTKAVNNNKVSYTLMPILNTQAYDPKIYTSDISCLNDLKNPGMLCIRSLTKYLEMTSQSYNNQNAQPQVMHQQKVDNINQILPIGQYSNQVNPNTLQSTLEVIQPKVKADLPPLTITQPSFVPQAQIPPVTMQNVHPQPIQQVPQQEQSQVQQPRRYYKPLNS